MPNKVGDRHERDLLNCLDERVWTVMRAPASGGGTDRELPDVLAGNGEQFYAIEAKYSSGNPIYLDADEVAALQRFSAGFGAYPAVAAKYPVRNGHPAWGVDDDTGHRFFRIEDIVTNVGAHRVDEEMWHEIGKDFEDLREGL